ncbi:hypothetical protein NPIL_17221, partial [Nephila pilipes]
TLILAYIPSPEMEQMNKSLPLMIGLVIMANDYFSINALYYSFVILEIFFS